MLPPQELDSSYVRSLVQFAILGVKSDWNDQQYGGDIQSYPGIRSNFLSFFHQGVQVLPLSVIGRRGGPGSNFLNAGQHSVVGTVVNSIT